MKRIISFFLVAVMCLSITACGKQESTVTEAVTTTEITESTINTEAETEAAPEIPVTQLKETVSTDIINLTLEHSKLTYYVSNSSSTYVEPTDTANSLFAAKMGTCYVSMTVTITNKDRGGSLNFCGSFSAWDPADWSVTYNGEEYEMYGFDLNSTNYDSISLSHGAIVNKETGKVITEVGSSNDLISAGETVTYRFFGIIKVDPTSLNDGFELNVKVPNSKGEFEEFKYIVPEITNETLYQDAIKLIENKNYYRAITIFEKIGNYKDSEMLYDECMKNWCVRYGVVDKPKDYFLANIDKFELVTGSELSSMMVGKWKLSKGSNAWDFLDNGTINDGWGNSRWWSVSEDNLILSTDKVTDTLTVKRVCENGYLLIKTDGTLYCTMYIPD